LIENEQLARILKQQGYEGFLAVEIDFLHPAYADREEEVVQKSVQALKEIGKRVS
jgi:3-oxoisoapionate decarboxylase